MTALLRADDLGKYYGPIAALKSATFSVDTGKVLAIIGPNGAGKTTLFKALTGEGLSSRGKVIFDGRDVTRLGAHQRAELGMGRTFQVARVFLNSTVLQNVIVAVEARRRRAGESLGGWLRVAPSADVVAEARATLADMGLEELAAQGHDLPARVLDWRQLSKLKSTYTDALVEEINPKTGRVHTNYARCRRWSGRRWCARVRSAN